MSLREDLLAITPKPPDVLRLTVKAPQRLEIIEWLSAQERRTGSELYAWAQSQYPGWAEFQSCEDKRGLKLAIRAAIRRCRNSGRVPVLHIEAHGSPEGLEGPGADGQAEFLLWEELTDPLHTLNLASYGDLILYVAACIGFAGIQAFHRGPRAMALALVGPDDDVNPGALLSGAKEFYRRMHDKTWSILAAAECASREMAPIGLEVESFVEMAFDSMIRSLLIGRKRAQVPPEVTQAIWDHMFMMDIKPSNRDRFGVNMTAVIDCVRARVSGDPIAV